MKQTNPVVVVIAAMLTTTISLTQVGCDSKDDRIANLAQRTVTEQARQNERMAEQGKQLTEASKQLVKHDALARREMIDRHADLQETIQEQQTNLDHQRDRVEHERKAIADQRQRDPIVAQSIGAVGLTIACLLPLVLAAYVLYTANKSTDNEQRLNEILIGELTSDSPRLLPRLLPPTSSGIPSLVDQRQDNDHEDNNEERDPPF